MAVVVVANHTPHSDNLQKRDNTMKHILPLDYDAYKSSHFDMLDFDITNDSRYLEARLKYESLYVFGIQYVLKEYLTKPITQEDLDEAFPILETLGTGYNKSGWEYILKEHGGYLPIEIYAVDEGTVLPTGNVILQYANTDPKCVWLSGVLETMLMRAWFPMTVATKSYNIKQEILKYTNNIDYKLNDFGSRSCSSFETSGIGGMAHLTQFKGTDNVPGIYFMKKYYGYEAKYASVKATEHSIMTQRGKDRNLEIVDKIVRAYPNDITSIVIDAYDDDAVLDYIGTTLKEVVKQRTQPLVVRPDTGNPIDAILKAFYSLKKYFGCEKVNYKYLLPPYIRIIQGDGINENSIKEILRRLDILDIHVDNICFGMGSALLQNVGRDDLRFAIKSSEVTLSDGTTREIFKQPKDDVWKKSKSGKLALVKRDGKFITIKSSELQENEENLLKLVYKNGKLMNEQSFPFNL